MGAQPMTRVEHVPIRRGQDWPRYPYSYHREGYYGIPPLKHSHYRWTIAASFFCGGVAGASHLLSAILETADREGGQPVVRTARLMTPVAAVISALLYIKDLGTPHRWFNMLRIFRPTSFMSIGTWSLTMLGAFSGLAATAQVIEDLRIIRGPRRRIATLSSLPALPFATIVSLYMGTELEETSTPFWANSSPHLPSLFVVDNMSNALALFEITALFTQVPRSTARRFNILNILLGAAELVLLRIVETRWTGTEEETPLYRIGQRLLYRTGTISLLKVIGLALRIVSLSEGDGDRRLSSLAPLVTLISGFLLPAVLLFSGNRSADTPEDYFAYAGAESIGSAIRVPEAETKVGRRQRKKRRGEVRRLLLGTMILGAGALTAYLLLGRYGRGGSSDPQAMASA